LFTPYLLIKIEQQITCQYRFVDFLELLTYFGDMFCRRGKEAEKPFRIG
jgi:hypothetical protein